MRRRQPPAPAAGTVPEWVRRFLFEDWHDPTEQPPDYWQDPHRWPSWWEIRAWRRWQDACLEWAADRPDIDLFALQHPETAANLRAARRA